MTRRPGAGDAADNPLAGVLGRLLSRERGAGAQATARAGASDLRVAATGRASPRVVVVAGVGEGGGSSALRWAAQWAVVLGRRPAVVDLFGGEGRGSGEAEDGSTSCGESVPRARVPCDPDALKQQPTAAILDLLDRLRRHEAASDVLLVRIPATHRCWLMRAALLSGAVVVPVDDSDVGLHEAVDISREAIDNLPDVRLWPFSGSPEALDRYIAMLGEDVRDAPVPFDPGRLDLAAELPSLRIPPESGFVAALLVPGSDVLSPGILQLDSMPF